MQTPHTNVDRFSSFFLIFLSSFCLFPALTNSLATMVVAALLHRDTWTLVKLRPTVFFPCASPHSSTLSSHFPFFTPHQFPLSSVLNGFPTTTFCMCEVGYNTLFSRTPYGYQAVLSTTNTSIFSHPTAINY
ncbi:hypothetical protein V8G54_022735 [Vigna mungo]|uniref:Uncharacterized protein n=1 Tax=Vigna mungo TaxID=3915 RepID=A0AAQ3RNJ1_VIGMU